ncbi:carbonyl reductase [NADPH] 1-like protein [Tanacetum coccineum]
MISMMLLLVFPPRRGMTTVATRSDNFVDSAKNVINTKYIGTKNMITTVLPYMRSFAECARIVLVSSRLGWLNGWKNRNADVALKQQLEDTESLSVSLIDQL